MDKLININLPSNIRESHTPQVGDIYFHDSSYGYDQFLRLDAFVKTPEGYTYFTCSYFDFETLSFQKSETKLYLSSLRESQYYKLLLHPFEQLLNETLLITEENQSETVETSGSMDLTIMNKDIVQNILQTAETKKDALLMKQRIFEAKATQYKAKMEALEKKLMPELKKLEREIDLCKKVLSWLRVYTGKDISFQQICSGERASPDTPLSIRQRILFMDEEVAVVNKDGQGLDYTQKEEFYQWLKNPQNRDIILPEKRCVVVMKPKRYDHYYSSDSYINSIINQRNKHSFVMIRDGENVYAIESDNLCIYGAAIPRKSDYERLKASNTWSMGRFDEENYQRELNELKSRSMFYLMLLQGLIDNGEIFGPHTEINISKNINTVIIFDDETDSLIGSGIKPFREYQSELSANIKRGSRVLYIGSNERSSSGGKFKRYYEYEYSAPDTPWPGLYSVDEENGELSFKYMPGETIFDQTEGRWRARKNRVTWIFNLSSVINFDSLDLDILNTYLNDRSQRQYYRPIMKFLLVARKEKEKEHNEESAFINIMVQQIVSETSLPDTDIRAIVTDVIQWWKHKVIYKRALTSDDAKAWRMIKKETMRRVKL